MTCCPVHLTNPPKIASADEAEAVCVILPSEGPKEFTVNFQVTSAMPFPVDIKYVKEAERKLGVRFPLSYVTRIVQSNGGEVQTPTDDWMLYPIFDTSDKKRLKRTCNDVTRETKSAKEWPDFPPDAVAIGSNYCGDKLIFIPHSSEPRFLAPEVYWWDHETGSVDKVADDFDDLYHAQA